ncbi:hypothetical protein KIL84_021549 [Mauremys mutica]|uniref:Uncharacterized protein n=1 Tax=Mauremys mutica TaxID=74926 RepID=A0A9D3X9F5_9SAUR|nr:hypothetical protein KIL84_021549 [Mauremys mutica]
MPWLSSGASDLHFQNVNVGAAEATRKRIGTVQYVNRGWPDSALTDAPILSASCSGRSRACLCLCRAQHSFPLGTRAVHTDSNVGAGGGGKRAGHGQPLFAPGRKALCGLLEPGLRADPAAPVLT